MPTKHTGHCDNCNINFEVIITWSNNDTGEDVSNIKPHVCPQCGKTYTMRFDTDPSRWYGVIGSNG